MIVLTANLKSPVYFPVIPNSYASISPSLAEVFIWIVKICEKIDVLFLVDYQ